MFWALATKKIIVRNQNENAYLNICIRKYDRHKLVSNSVSICKHDRQHYEVCNVRRILGSIEVMLQPSYFVYTNFWSSLSEKEHVKSDL